MTHSNWFWTRIRACVYESPGQRPWFKLWELLELWLRVNTFSENFVAQKYLLALAKLSKMAEFNRIPYKLRKLGKPEPPTLVLPWRVGKYLMVVLFFSKKNVMKLKDSNLSLSQEKCSEVWIEDSFIRPWERYGKTEPWRKVTNIEISFVGFNLWMWHKFSWFESIEDFFCFHSGRLRKSRKFNKYFSLWVDPCLAFCLPPVFILTNRARKGNKTSAQIQFWK